jgi:cephalosporin hydroxylase
MAARRDAETVRAERSAGDPLAIDAMARDPKARDAARDWIAVATRHGYSYNFAWLGVPIIQHPEDVVVLQELIWEVRPDLVIETGIAHGGSLLLSASILRLLGGEREVLGVDLDIRAHTRATLATHPLAGAIRTIEGDSVGDEVIEQVRAVAARHDRALVILDSDHSAAHVAAELARYADFVTVGSYLVAMDTVLRDLPADASKDRPWGPDDNPWTAVESFLAADGRFEAAEVNRKLLATAAPGGYLRRIR